MGGVWSPANQIAAIRAKEIYEGALAASRAQAEHAREAPGRCSRPAPPTGRRVDGAPARLVAGWYSHTCVRPGGAVICMSTQGRVRVDGLLRCVPWAARDVVLSCGPLARRPRGRPPRAASGSARASRALSVPSRGSSCYDNPRVAMTLRSSLLVVPQPAASRQARSVPRKRTTPIVSK